MQQIRKFIFGALAGAFVLFILHAPQQTPIEKDTTITLARINISVTPTVTVIPSPTLRVVVKSAQKKKPEVLGISTVSAELRIEITPTVTTQPTAIPSPTIVSSINEAVPHHEHFEQYSQAFNVDKTLLIKIAKCESGFRPDAASGPYLGMYQYLASTWSSTRKAMGENPDPALRTSPEEAIKTTAWKIAHGGQGAWPVCGKA